MSAPFSRFESGVFSPRVDDPHDFDRVGTHFVDQYVVWVDDRLASTGGTASAIHIGMLRQSFGASNDRFA